MTLYFKNITIQLVICLIKRCEINKKQFRPLIKPHYIYTFSLSLYIQQKTD